MCVCVYVCALFDPMQQREQQIQLCSGFLSSPQGKGVNTLQKERKRKRTRKNKRGADDRFKRDPGGIIQGYVTRVRSGKTANLLIKKSFDKL